MEADSLSPQTAAQHFFSTPELLRLILFESFNPQEKIDLLVLSNVSKLLRALALPTLVHKLSVPFSGAESIRLCLAGNPGLVEHIRHIRLWDDDVHRVFRHRQDPTAARLSLDYDSQRLPLFDCLGDFLCLVQDRRVLPLPLVDISFGEDGLDHLEAQLERTPPLIDRITALRTLVDFDEVYYNDAEGNFDEDFYRERVDDGWYKRYNLVKKVSSSQDQSGSTTFRLLASDDYGYDQAERQEIHDEYWKDFAAHISPRIKDFSINFSNLELQSFTSRGLFNDVNWPFLRSLKFNAASHMTTEWDQVERNLSRFLDNNTQLEELSILLEDGELAGFNLTQTFPNLRTLALQVSERNCASTALFASRHPNLQDVHLGFYCCEAEFYRPIVEQAAFLDALRILRPPPKVAREFIRHGAKNIALLRTDWNSFDEIGFHRWLFTNQAACDKITCLDFEIEGEELPDVLRKLRQRAPSGRLPNLKELCICNVARSRLLDMEELWKSVRHLKAFLRILTLWDCSQLESVRIEFSTANPIPEDDGRLTMPLGDVPASLKYVTWHATKPNITQYFRVLRSATQASLQQLPDSFRLVVNEEDGIWEQPSDLRKD
ncbi:hypothetical protein CF326_g5946 [Tilletia indica]|nr:hypothetical protein CF326_g5946 [Tilletia indica]